jgi:4-hydroxy-tetrahydrodipicolinate synthase
VHYVIELDDRFLRGSYPPIVTPLDAGGNVDLATYGRLVEAQVRSGSHGVVVNGTTAEPSTLTNSERMAVAAHGVETAAGRVPVVVATGAQSLAETIHLTKHADAIGADALLVVTPYYIRPPQRGLVDYFAAVAAHSELPLLLYHIPGRAGVEVTLPSLEAIASRVPSFVGMKHAHSDLGLVSDAIAAFGDGFRIFVGLEELSFPMLALGAAGMVNAVANVAPGKVAALYEAMAAGKFDEGRRLHFELLELNRAIFYDTNPIPLKYMMKRLGHLADNVHRLPMVRAAPDVAARCDDVLARAGLL